MRDRTQAAPPSRLHFSHSSSVIRIGRAFISSPVFAKGFRPWLRPAPPRLVEISAMLHTFSEGFVAARADRDTCFVLDL